MNHIHLLNKMGARIKLRKNTAHIKGVKTIYGMDLVGSDLRSSAALIIAGIIAKGNSKIYGLEHLDRGYENFESKLKILGIKITREFNNNTFTENENKVEKNSEDIQKHIRVCADNLVKPLPHHIPMSLDKTMGKPAVGQGFQYIGDTAVFHGLNHRQHFLAVFSRPEGGGG